MDMRDIGRSIAHLSPEKRALLDRRLAELGLLVDQTIPRREQPGPCRLSFAQEGLWFLEQILPQSCLYNIPYAARLRGALQVDALRQALNILVARHDTLRTTYLAGGEEPLQAVAERGAVDLPVRDLRAITADEREQELGSELSAEARRPFDLSSDLMLRALLLRLEDREHVLLVTVHHIAADGWSLRILAQELSAAYAACLAGRAPALPPLPVQYTDFAVWQRGRLQGAVLEQQLAYWTRTLQDAPPVIAMPTDRSRASGLSFRGASAGVTLPVSLRDALRALAGRERATLFMTLLAAFSTLLARYTGQDDIVVGFPVANRNHTELEPLVGFLVNTLALRTDLSGDPTFLHLLARVREAAIGAYDHQDLPFEKLVEAMRPDRSLSGRPIVQMMFALDDAGELPLNLPGVTASRVEVSTGTAKFDLSVSAKEVPAGLRVTLTFDTDLYDPATIQRMLGHYTTLLAGIVTDPGQRLSGLPLLADPERQQLLVEWNAPVLALPASGCLHELFEAQVARTPDAPAVTFDRQSLTYRQLNERANQLAHFLRRRGVRPEVLVGLCLERSIDMIVGLLGILKAGGAYVPFNPTDPPERLIRMRDEAGIAILIAHQEGVGRLPRHQTRVVCLDTDAPEVAREDRANPGAGAALDNLAYVIHTSGSTGQPRGVMISHRAVSNLMQWRQAAPHFRIDSGEVVLQQAPFTFDFSVDEIFHPLLAGGRLVLAQPEEHRDCRSLVETIQTEHISRLGLVPSLMQAMAEEPGLERCTSVRWVVSGGEALPWEVLRRFRARLKNVHLVNTYGPTETTVDATYWVAGQAASSDVAPIGRAMANARLYVLDAHMQPVPVGVPGELYIGGVGVARGYLGRPDITAERFLPNPFGAEPGGRLYKTGDLVRYLPDGNLEYLGRLDHQVKVLGYRIELGEIESALRSHADVRDAAVVLREDTRGDKRLVAYVVPQSGAAPTHDAMRQFARAKLPEYMVPRAFVLLSSLPLTPSGKVDRRRLPAPDPVRADDAYVAPRDATERQLAQMWEELLGVHPVGARDNFFDLGGHSLLAGRLLARVRATFQVEVSLRAFFARPTVADLATGILQALAEGAGVEAVRRALAEVEQLSGGTAEEGLPDA